MKYYRIENKEDKTDFSVIEVDDSFESIQCDEYNIMEISKEQYKFSLDKMVRPMVK